jgi:hypothetical protein
MYPIKNMWSEVQKTMQDTWPDLHLRNRDDLWTLVSHAWNELLRLSIMFNLSDHAEKNEICG